MITPVPATISAYAKCACPCIARRNRAHAHIRAVRCLRADPQTSRQHKPATEQASISEASWQQALKLQVASVLCSAVLCLPGLCFAEPVLTNKPAFATDYATAVRKREGKTKSNLPSAREAEALLEINEELFTTEALEGMSR